MCARRLHLVRLVDPDRSGGKETGIGDVRSTEGCSNPVSSAIR